MMEIVLESKTLPEPLYRLLKVEKVKVRQHNDEVHLTPVIEVEGSCPFLGIAMDCGFTVDEFLARKREEKEQEGE